MAKRKSTAGRRAGLFIGGVMFGLVSCLKGLESQGCNGAVPKAIEKIDKYLNEKAHR